MVRCYLSGAVFCRTSCRRLQARNVIGGICQVHFRPEQPLQAWHRDVTATRARPRAASATLIMTGQKCDTASRAWRVRAGEGRRRRKRSCRRLTGARLPQYRDLLAGVQRDRLDVRFGTRGAGVVQVELHLLPQHHHTIDAARPGPDAAAKGRPRARADRGEASLAANNNTQYCTQHDAE
jgi:hypothetical protein